MCSYDQHLNAMVQNLSQIKNAIDRNTGMQANILVQLKELCGDLVKSPVLKVAPMSSGKILNTGEAKIWPKV